MPRASKTGVRGLYRDDDGRYRIDLRWTHPTTSKPLRHREHLPAGLPIAAAKLRARTLLAGALDGSFVPGAPEAKPIALGPALDEYIEVQRASGLRSLRTKRSHAKVIVEAIGRDREVRSLVALDLARVAKRLRDRDREPGTVNRALTTARHFLRWCALMGYTTTGAAEEACRVPKLREPEGRVRWVTPDEERTFAALDGWLRDLVDALRLSGCRLGELTALRWRSVDLARDELHLARTKSGKPRLVRVQAALRAVLDRLPRGDAHAFVFPIAYREPELPDLAERERERRIAQGRVHAASQAFATWARGAGLRDLHMHDLRHDFATRVRRAGGGLDVIAKLLGHASLAMSTRYAHLGDDDLRAVLANITIPVAPSMPTAGVLPLRLRAANDTEEGGNVGGNSKRAMGFEPTTFSMGS